MYNTIHISCPWIRLTCIIKLIQTDIIAIIFNILTPTIVLTTTSSNFFYNNYSIKYFITLNRLTPIKTAKNIVIFINNNALIYSLTGSTESSNIEPGTARHGNISNKSSNNKSRVPPTSVTTIMIIITLLTY